MYTKDNSWNSFVTHMIEEGYAQNEDTLLEYMALIPAKSREIIEKRWGLIEKVYYSSFEQLNEQLGIDNARELYFEAIRDLFNAEYAAIGMKRYNMQTISHWNEVVTLGMLFAEDTTNAATHENLKKEEETTIAKKDNSELLKKPLEEFENLYTPLLHSFLRDGCKTLGDVLNYNATSLKRLDCFDLDQAKELIIFIKSLGIEENEGKTLCFSLANYFGLYHILSEQKFNTQDSTSDILKSPFAKFDSFSTKLCRILDAASLYTLEDLINLSKQVMPLPGIGKSHAMELMRALELIGIADNEGKEIYTFLARNFKLHSYTTAEKQDTAISIQNSTSDILKRRLIEFENAHDCIRNILYYKFRYRTLEDLLNCDTELLKRKLFSGSNGFYWEAKVIYFLKDIGITYEEYNGIHLAFAERFHLHRFLPSESN